MAKGDNVVLIGMPGVGKSTIGVVLAKMIGYGFVDGDLLIQGRYGKTLQYIIDERGTDGFLDIENEVLSRVDAERTVIAPGGSAVYSDKAMRHLGEIGTIVYLRVPLEELEQRLGGLHERGVIMREGMGGLADIFHERQPLYERYADIIYDADCKTIRETATDLAKLLSR